MLVSLSVISSTLTTPAKTASDFPPATPDQAKVLTVFLSKNPYLPIEPNFDTEIEHLKDVQKQRADEQAKIEQQKEAEKQAQIQALENAYVAPIVQTTNYAVSNAVGTLYGSIGYALSHGNCVNEPGVNRVPGNPSSWPVLTQTPTIGATFLFWTNHTGVVTGIWSNGDIEVRHQNWWGAPVHRFPRSMFRGFR